MAIAVGPLVKLVTLHAQGGPALPVPQGAPREQNPCRCATKAAAMHGGGPDARQSEELCHGADHQAVRRSPKQTSKQKYQSPAVPKSINQGEKKAT